MNDTAMTACRSIMNAETIERAKALASIWLEQNLPTAGNWLFGFKITTATDTLNEINWYKYASKHEHREDILFVLRALYKRQKGA